MKESKSSIVFILAIIVGWVVSIFFSYHIGQNNAWRVEIVRDTVYIQKEWSRMIDALIMVESNGNPNAVNESTDAQGVLQITPIYVEECNRLGGNFVLDDRKDPLKSLEMFELYQSHYNAEKDIDKAIRLHNPRAGKWYFDKVKANML